MKKVLRGILIFAVVLAGSFLMKTAVVSAADDFATVHTNSSWDVKDRSVNGTVFTTSSYSSNGWVLTAKKGGKTIKISNCSNGGCVLSNGTIVLYCTSKSDGFVLYKMNLSTGKKVKYRGMAGSSDWGVELCGKYGKDIYFIRNVPEGTFCKVNLSTKKVTKIKNIVSSAAQQGKYLYLRDGTGAGFSYLGQWNAQANKYIKIGSRPTIYKANSRYVYYTESAGYDSNGLQTISVKRYSNADGKRKTLISSMKVKYTVDITSTYIKYVDVNGNQKTRKF